ncbi:MAG: hypothetical protein IJD97_10090 [Clostridia bacterium]|nr:hypothetical protein [Clostridia bacterium]
MNKNEQIALAAELLKISEEEIKNNCKDLEALKAIYISIPVKGGPSLIVSEDGSVLYAASSVSPAEHVEAFINGIRTPLESFS